MKPITNILLVLALVCYVFLPLFNADLFGAITGLSFTSSLITQSSNTYSTFYALIPFVSLFFAIGVNCLKNRYWGIASTVFIVVALHFFVFLVAEFKGLSLEHDPEVVASTEMGEGLPVRLGIGYYASAAFTTLALISALISLMPFKFNKRLEQSIDSKIGKGLEESRKQISKMSHGIHDEINKRSSKKQKTAEPEAEPAPESAKDEPQPNPEDDSRFMPPGAATSHEDYMPK